jgi:hypothetical protein
LFSCPGSHAADPRSESFLLAALLAHFFHGRHMKFG